MLIHREMCEHPESVSFRVALQKKVPHDKIDTLSVTHGGEVVRYAFKYFFEEHLGVLLKGKGAIEIFFDLLKARVVVGDAFQLMVRGIAINFFLLLIRWFVMFVSHLKSQTTPIHIILFFKTIE